MEIFLIKKPYEISLSGNPIVFSFGLSPYGTREKTQDIHLQVTILLEQTNGSGFYTEIKTQEFYPTGEGQFQLEIQSILDPYLEYYLPRPDMDQPQRCPDHVKKYKLTWILMNAEAIISGPSQSSVYYVCKSSLNYESWHPSEFFTKKILIDKAPLLFIAANEKFGVDEVRFLSWIYPYDDGLTQTVVYSMYLNDGSIVTKNVTAIAAIKWSVFCAPAGFTQLDFNSLVPLGMVAIKWSIKIMASATTIVSEIVYEIDQRNFYETYQLIYRNSIGGLETIRLRGQVDFAADYDRQLAAKTLPPSWYNNMDLLPQSSDENVEELANFTGDTGFLSKAGCDKLRDLFLSPQKMQLVDQRLLPIVINSKKTKFFTNKDSLISTVVEWSPAYSNKAYTPTNYMPVARTCPAVQTFIVRQVSKNKLQIIYALEFPYNQVEVTLVVGPNIFIYNYFGNSKTVIQDFYNPADTLGVPPLPGVEILYPIGGDYPITVKGRTVCNPASNPVDFGPYATIDMNVVGNRPPIVVDDYYSINAGFNAAVTLTPSAMDNDYDPDDDPIEVVAASGPTNLGGSYTINAAGIVTYTPPSSSFQGNDWFDYAVRPVGGTDTAGGTVYIKVGGGILFIYAKLVYVGYNSTFSNAGEVWINFYSNPAATIPVDVSGSSFTVNYNQHVHGVAHGGVTVGPDTDTAGSIAATGVRVKIYTGPLYTESPHVPITNAYASFTTTFTLQPGSGYIAI